MDGSWSGLIGWLGNWDCIEGAMLLDWSVLQHTGVRCCLFGQSCNIRGLYVACLVSLAIYRAYMLLVWVVLQYSRALCCLFGNDSLRMYTFACLSMYNTYKLAIILLR